MYLRFFFEEMSDLQLFAKKPIKAVNDLKNIKFTAARKVFEKDDFESYYLLSYVPTCCFSELRRVRWFICKSTLQRTIPPADCSLAWK